MSRERTKEKVVLGPNEFYYLQDENAGALKVIVGPMVVDPATHERPVLYDASDDQFQVTSQFSEAVQKNVSVQQGDYVILHNPSVTGKHPDPKSQQVTQELRIGEKIVIPGPVSFALWPGQHAIVVPGHRLRSNQFLFIEVYDEKAARENWEKSVLKPVSDDEDKSKSKKGKVKGMAVPEDLAVGMRYSIRGTEYSYYVPPTGVEVVQDSSTDRYVREALSLERLEYAILVDEDGNKRYPKGPCVVFPKPTERFFMGKNDTRRFRAIELNEIQCLHLKAIADFEFSELGKTLKEGTEFSITGKEVPIFYPRPEIALVKYDGRSVHYAVAVPEGEGKYVMNRKTGDIRTAQGPTMLLPDPVSEIIVLRALSEAECGDYYPGNEKVAEHNRQLRAQVAKSPTTRSGAISEGDHRRRSKKGSMGRSLGQMEAMAMSQNYAAEASLTSYDQAAVADEISRGSTFTQPRTITLDTKLSGAVRVRPWTGFAVQVVKPDGSSRVEIGPNDLLLDYGENLAHLFLSTGRPKGQGKRKRTVYLQYVNNRVGDALIVETKDHVQLSLELEYMVDFDVALRDSWWNVEDYVRLLAERTRSMLRAYVRGLTIAEFYGQSELLIRDFLLGKKKKGEDRSGLSFSENGMRVKDVHIVNVHIRDKNVNQVLQQAQQEAVLNTITLERSQAKLDVTRQVTEIEKEEAVVRSDKMKHHHALELEAIQRRLDETLAQQQSEHAKKVKALEAALAEQQEGHKLTEANETEQTYIAQVVRERKEAEAEAARKRKEQDANLDIQVAAERLKQRLEELDAQTVSRSKILEAVKGPMAEVFAAASDRETAVRVAQAISANRLFETSYGDDLVKILRGAGLADVAEKLVGALQTKR
jgi:major vault protein